MFEIEKNVKVEEGSRGPNFTYPFGEMEVGDSFAAPIALKRKLASAASYYGKRRGKRFSVVAVSSDTVRCWRTA